MQGRRGGVIPVRITLVARYFGVSHSGFCLVAQISETMGFVFQSLVGEAEACRGGILTRRHHYQVAVTWQPTRVEVPAGMALA
jgi:hypothetical protein